MKNFFLHQLVHQRHPEYQPLTSVLPICNVKNSMAKSLKALSKITYNNDDAFQAFSVNSKYFELMAENPKTFNVDNIPPETLRQWVYDSEFDELLTKNSHMEVKLQDPILKFVVSEFLNAIGLDPAHLAVSRAKLNIQKPGQIFPLHLDRVRHNDYHADEKQLVSDPSHDRFLIFLEDQQPGQMFQFDMCNITWSAGDVFTWNARDTMHASANTGYWTRRLLLIDVGKKT
jgi:hypothetical protein